MRALLFAIFKLVAISLLPLAANADDGAQTLTKIKERGFLICGVGTDDIGFATQLASGVWTGFDVDFCRAVAAAVLGDAQAVDFVPLDSLNRLNVLQDGGVDVLFRTTTYNFERDVVLDFEFPVITYYDTQKVLVYSDLNAKSLADLDGRAICANSGTTSIENIKKAISKANVEIEILEISSQSGRWRAFFGRECDAVTADASDLSARIAAQPHYKDAFNFLDEEVSNEPLGAVVRADDPHWAHIIRWVTNVLITAEAEGVDYDSDLARIEALHLPDGKAMGLSDDWWQNVILQVGNYESVYSRNLGAGSELDLPRGLNHLWINGGLLYPLPM